MAKHIHICTVLCLFLSIIVYGCMPVQYVYYEPIAVEGELSHSQPGIVSGKDTIEYSLNNTKLKIEGGSTGFYLIVIVPKGGLVRFVSSEVEWYLPGSQKRMKARFYLKYYDSQGSRFQAEPTDTMVNIGRGESSFRGPESGIYENFVKLDEVKKDHYFIMLPAIEINGQVFEIPTIEFVKKEGLGVFPINS